MFRLNTDGSDYAILKTFVGSEGIGPMGLTLSGSTLYGTTYKGGPVGTVFKINTDGSGYTVLKNVLRWRREDFYCPRRCNGVNTWSKT